MPESVNTRRRTIKCTHSYTHTHTHEHDLLQSFVHAGMHVQPELVPSDAVRVHPGAAHLARLLEHGHIASGSQRMLGRTNASRSGTNYGDVHTDRRVPVSRIRVPPHKQHARLRAQTHTRFTHSLTRDDEDTGEDARTSLGAAVSAGVCVCVRICCRRRSENARSALAGQRRRRLAATVWPERFRNNCIITLCVLCPPYNHAAKLALSTRYTRECLGLIVSAGVWCLRVWWRWALKCMGKYWNVADYYHLFHDGWHGLSTLECHPVAYYISLATISHTHTQTMCGVAGWCVRRVCVCAHVSLEQDNGIRLGCSFRWFRHGKKICIKQCQPESHWPTLYSVRTECAGGVCAMHTLTQTLFYHKMHLAWRSREIGGVCMHRAQFSFGIVSDGIILFNNVSF